MNETKNVIKFKNSKHYKIKTVNKTISLRNTFTKSNLIEN